jgi:sensor histidine kinase regulating citrate/malate metabolism
MFTLFHFLNYLLKERSSAFIKEKVLKDNTEQLLQTKHDLLKEYRMIQHMLKSKKIKSAKRIIDSQVGVIEKIQAIFNTGHEELDYILNIKQKEAGENQIKIEANLNLSNMIRTNYGELNMILWNVLDNAIEASKMVPKNQRTINLKLDFNHGVLLIIAENPCNKETVHFEDGIYKTSKEDKVNHGHGLKIIKKLVKKYEGTVKIEHKEKKFSIEILLFLN